MMGERKEKRYATQNHDRTWQALGKTFRRQGQAEKHIRKSGFAVGKAFGDSGGWL